jgi:hypothetical protein
MCWKHPLKDNWRTEPGTVPRHLTRRVLILYDYTNNVGYRVVADFPYARQREGGAHAAKEQPDLCSVRWSIRRRCRFWLADPKFGEPLRRGIAFCSPGMPPVITAGRLPSVLGAV